MDIFRYAQLSFVFLVNIARPVRAAAKSIFTVKY